MSDEIENLIKELIKVHANIKEIIIDLKELIKEKHQIEAQIRLLKR